jgi:short-subunit dehydrogenase
MDKKVALVTGASQGLGREIAKQLTQKGYHVILVARTEKLLAGVTSEITIAGGSAEYVILDITKPEDIKSIIEKITRKNQIDILVNNAGVYYEDPTDNTSEEKLVKMFATNTLGTIRVTQALLPQFKKLNSGQILNIISVAGIEASADWGLYASSKFALTGFTESLRRELSATKIKVMGLYPEGIDTNIFRNAGYQEEPNQKWMMKPADIAEVAVFMLMRPPDVNLSQIVVRKIEM